VRRSSRRNARRSSRRALVDRHRHHGRCGGLFLARPRGDFHAICIRSLDLRDSGRLDDGFHGGEHCHRTVVFAPARSRPRPLEHGGWFRESLYAALCGVAHGLARLASNVVGFRARDFSPRGRASSFVHQIKI
jgi:hypothetical protein